MPELPEVETIRAGIKDKLIGKKIADVEVKVSKLFQGDKKKIIGTKIIDTRRVAKILIIDLNNDYSIIIHLKMSGQLIFRDKNSKKTFAGGHNQKAYMQEPPHKYTYIIYEFTDGSHLYFNDFRKFGWNKIVKSNEVMKLLGPGNYGPEPITKDFTLDYLKKVFSRSTKSIKLVIMDQEKISGLGNIYANDALYDAGISPKKSAKLLSHKEISQLKDSIEKVIKSGIKYHGSSQNTYVDLEGNRGSYLDHALVYQKKTDPKGHTVKRIALGGRGTFLCEICQK